MKIIHTMTEYIQAIQRIQNAKPLSINDAIQGKPNYFYRGQCNDYLPLPSVLRDQFMDNEHYMYHELILRCPEVFHGLSHLDTLVMMQHYGLPTRLLDVTSNPLVALYFACKDYSNSNKDVKGYIYIYGVADDNLVYSDSDRVLMLACLPVFSPQKKKKMLNTVNSHLEDGEFRMTTKGKYPAEIERLYYEITKEVPAFKREIKPQDLITPIIVKPIRSNARIIKQDGAFIISGLSEGKQEAEKKIQEMCCEVIEINNIDSILLELDSFGISEATLFPEVDRVASYLKDQYTQKLSTEKNNNFLNNQKLIS